MFPYVYKLNKLQETSMSTLQSKIRISNLKVWHLIVLNVFFVFSGEFMAYIFDLELAFRYAVIILFQLIFICFLFILFRPFSEINFFSKSGLRSKALVEGVIIGVVFWFAMLVSQISWRSLLLMCELDACNDILDYYAIGSGPGTGIEPRLYWIMVVSFVFVGPIKEELLYRITMYNLISKRGRSALFSAGLVALIFALFHLRYFIFFAMFSLTLSALLKQYRSIVPLVIAHGIYNWLIYFVLPLGKAYSESSASLLVVLLSSCLMMLLFYRAVRIILATEKH